MALFLNPFATTLYWGKKYLRWQRPVSNGNGNESIMIATEGLPAHMVECSNNISQQPSCRSGLSALDVKDRSGIFIVLGRSFSTALFLLY
jgi:hypothetical protein